MQPPVANAFSNSSVNFAGNESGHVDAIDVRADSKFRVSSNDSVQNTLGNPNRCMIAIIVLVDSLRAISDPGTRDPGIETCRNNCFLTVS